MEKKARTQSGMVVVFVCEPVKSYKKLRDIHEQVKAGLKRYADVVTVLPDIQQTKDGDKFLFTSPLRSVKALWETFVDGVLVFDIIERQLVSSSRACGVVPSWEFYEMALRMWSI